MSRSLLQNVLIALAVVLAGTAFMSSPEAQSRIKDVNAFITNFPIAADGSLRVSSNTSAPRFVFQKAADGIPVAPGQTVMLPPFQTGGFRTATLLVRATYPPIAEGSSCYNFSAVDLWGGDGMFVPVISDVTGAANALSVASNACFNPAAPDALQVALLGRGGEVRGPELSLRLDVSRSDGSTGGDPVKVEAWIYASE